MNEEATSTITAQIPRAARWLASRVGTPEDASDIASEAFLRVTARHSGNTAPVRPVSYYWTAVRHGLTSHYRGEAQRAQLESPPAQEGYGTLSTETMTHIRALPLRQQQVVLGRFAYSMTPTEVATALGLTLHNERVILHRALRALRAAM